MPLGDLALNGDGLGFGLGVGGIGQVPMKDYMVLIYCQPQITLA